MRFRVPTARLAFSDRSMTRVVEPGAVELWVGRSCEDRLLEAEVQLVGALHRLTPECPRWATVDVVEVVDPA